MVNSSKEGLTDTEPEPTALKLRDGPHVRDDDIHIPDFEFPTKDKYDFDNPIVGF
jgi:hypothetical protein